MEKITDFYDRCRARIAIWILRSLYGECAPPYVDGCAACDSARVIRNLREIGS